LDALHLRKTGGARGAAQAAGYDLQRGFCLRLLQAVGADEQFRELAPELDFATQIGERLRLHVPVAVSKDWKRKPPVFPDIGKSRAIFSKAWKIFARFFQSLEINPATPSGTRRCSWSSSGG
jgi:hypothetical protein